MPLFSSYGKGHLSCHPQPHYSVHPTHAHCSPNHTLCAKFKYAYSRAYHLCMDAWCTGFSCIVMPDAQHWAIWTCISMPASNDLFWAHWCLMLSIKPYWCLMLIELLMQSIEPYWCLMHWVEDAWCTALIHGCIALSHNYYWCMLQGYWAIWCLMHSIELFWCLMHSIEP